MVVGDISGGRARGTAARGIPFVGRERELALLREALAEAEASRGSVVVLAGETGIGKTRTVREFARWAEDEGARVLEGGCYEGWSPPYGVFAEALSRHVRAVSRETLLEQAGDEAAVLAAFLPELRQAVPELPPPPVLPPDESRFRAHEALAGFLLRIADETLVVLLDDLQWADSASLEFLRYLGRLLAESRVLVVGTYREPEVDLAHPLSQTLAELDRQGVCVRLTLSELDRDEAASLIGRLAGTPAPELLEAILARTGGHPFFLGEVVLHLLAEGGELDGERLEPPGIPESVRQAVGRRLGRLDSDAAGLLGVACAFSRPFEFSVLGELTGLSEERLLECLDEALTARFLCEVGGERYDFAHALMRDALYTELSDSRRARLHRRIALALDSISSKQGEHASELATQYHLSRSLPGAEHGIPHALAAAEQAGAAYGSRQRVEFLRIARDLAVPGDRSLQSEILGRLALAEADALLVDDAVGSARAALELAPGDDPARGAEFLAELVWGLKDAGGRRELLDPLVQAGRELAGERRDLVWARLELGEYPVEIVARDPVPVGRWYGYDPEAVRLAREVGSELDYARTLEVMEWTPLEETEALLERVRGWSEPWARIHGLGVLARILLLQHGLRAAATVAAQDLLAASVEAGSLPGRAYADYVLAHEPLDRGDFTTARATLDRLLAVVERLGAGHRLRFSASFVEALLAQYVGHKTWADHARRLIRPAETARVPAWMTLGRLSLAGYLRALAGDSAGAARSLDPIVALSERLGPRTLNQSGVVAFAGGACWELGDERAAPRLRKQALALLDAEVGDYPTCSTELTVARTAALCGDDEQAAEYFARARASLEESERWPLRAIVDYDEALAHARRGKRRAAEPLVVSAQARFEQLGMAGWAERASKLTDSLERLEVFPDGLTAREVEILRHVAAGRTNQEIAAELVLSVHTVERHLANVYRKIAVRNRAEATTYTLRVGL